MVGLHHQTNPVALLSYSRPQAGLLLCLPAPVFLFFPPVLREEFFILERFNLSLSPFYLFPGSRRLFLESFALENSLVLFVDVPSFALILAARFEYL